MGLLQHQQGKGFVIGRYVLILLLILGLLSVCDKVRADDNFLDKHEVTIGWSFYTVHWSDDSQQDNDDESQFLCIMRFPYFFDMVSRMGASHQGDPRVLKSTVWPAMGVAMLTPDAFAAVFSRVMGSYQGWRARLKVPQ